MNGITAEAIQWLQHGLIVSRGARVPLILSGDKHHYVRRNGPTSPLN